MDCNGAYLLLSFVGTAALVGGWVGFLWHDEALRVRYPGLLYCPEPWAYYTLYIQ